MVESFPKIGEIANPGRALRAEIDHIPINVIREIIPFPVCICIALVFIQLCKKQLSFVKVHILLLEIKPLCVKILG